MRSVLGKQAYQEHLAVKDRANVGVPLRSEYLDCLPIVDVHCWTSACSAAAKDVASLDSEIHSKAHLWKLDEVQAAR